MREMDVKSEDLREKLRTTEAAAADAESGAAVVRTQLANNAETLLRLQREIGEQKERAGGYPVRSGSTAHASRASPPNGARWPTAQRNSAAARRKTPPAWTNRTSVSPPCSRMRVSSPVRSPRAARRSRFLRKTARRWKSALCRQRKSSPPRAEGRGSLGASHGREEAPE